ncbi:unnamed protein product [Diamesa serratosioi]
MKCFMLIIVFLAIISMILAQKKASNVVMKYEEVLKIDQLEVTESDKPKNADPAYNSAPFGQKSKFQPPQHWYGNSHGQKVGGRTH